MLSTSYSSHFIAMNTANDKQRSAAGALVQTSKHYTLNVI
jgi:hypothetical protein